MTILKNWLIRNSLLLCVLAANFMGIAIVRVLIQYSKPGLNEVDISNLLRAYSFFPLFWVVLITGLDLCYERPFRLCLKKFQAGKPMPETLLLKARQRLQNEPYIASFVCLVVWGIASFASAHMLEKAGAHEMRVTMTIVRSIITGLFSMAGAFFLMEHVIQNRLAHIFFPQGNLSATPKTIKGRIGIKMVALVLSAGILPFISILMTIKGSVKVASQGIRTPEELLTRLQSYLTAETMIFMMMALVFTILLSTNVSRSLKEIIAVLNKIKTGDFSSKVKVTSSDEIGFAGDVINDMAEGLKERDAIKEMFGRYVTEEIRDEIMSGRIRLGGELKEVTLLFSDLRDFTPLVEANPPEQVVRIINGYFKEMAEAIRECKGLVLQYVGDEIEAVFGAPLSLENHEDKAIEAALLMRKRLEAYNKQLEQNNLPILRHGIGIHTGKALAANIGSPDRLSYALVGDTVNLASRIQGLTKRFGTDILISDDTRRVLSHEPELMPLPIVKVKGRSEAVSVFALK